MRVAQRTRMKGGVCARGYSPTRHCFHRFRSRRSQSRSPHGNPVSPGQQTGGPCSGPTASVEGPVFGQVPRLSGRLQALAGRGVVEEERLGLVASAALSVIHSATTHSGSRAPLAEVYASRARAKRLLLITCITCAFGPANDHRVIAHPRGCAEAARRAGTRPRAATARLL